MPKHLEIANHQGRVLRGYLHYPLNFNGELVLMFHGFTGNKTEHGGHFRDLSRLLEEHNYASLRMDFSGNGESDGSFSDFTFDSMVTEANLLIDYALGIKNVERLTLLGFSMGGSLAAMLAGKRSQDISKLILWSPAANIIELIKTRYENSPKLDNLDADYGNYPLSHAMYNSLAHHDIFAGLDNFKNPVLIIHGKKDLAVNYEYSFAYQKRYANARVHLIESAGHGYDKSIEKRELLNKTFLFLRGK